MFPAQASTTQYKRLEETEEYTAGSEATTGAKSRGKYVLLCMRVRDALRKVEGRRLTIVPQYVTGYQVAARRWR